jgi:glyoxylase-like metal-dependent hydrolase (beta-lactamase superfamily II)
MRTDTAAQSRHFDLHQVADGVYAAIAANNGWASANAGIIDAGDHTIVFDAFLTPGAAQDLRRCAEQLTGRTPDLVVNSHYHCDHTGGNQVFSPACHILASAATERLMAATSQDTLAWNKANAAARLKLLRARLHHAQSDAQRADLSMWIAYYQGLVHELPHLTLRLPDATFVNRRTIHGSKRAVKLISYAGAHTGSDTILYLPGEAAFVGDLLFVGAHPYLSDGDPQRLLTVLHALAALDAPVIVPGHGPVGTRDDIVLMAAYVEECLRTARTFVGSGKSEDALITDIAIPEPYNHWQQPNLFHANIAALTQRLA